MIFIIFSQLHSPCVRHKEGSPFFLFLQQNWRVFWISWKEVCFQGKLNKISGFLVEISVPISRLFDEHQQHTTPNLCQVVLHHAGRWFLFSLTYNEFYNNCNDSDTFFNQRLNHQLLRNSTRSINNYDSVTAMLITLLEDNSSTDMNHQGYTKALDSWFFQNLT